jgi:hypothetical protein
MNKYTVLLSIVVFVFFSANVSQAIMITDLTGIYETAVTEQYSEAQLKNVFDSIMDEASTSSSADKESWKQALLVLQEYAQTQEDNVSKLTVIMLPGYIAELTQVPEPSVLLLLCAGFVGLAFRRMSITQ